jgi:hypothetical protein
MKQEQRSVILALLLLNLVVASGWVLGQETADSPVGRWVSIACELRPGPQYLRRDFTIAEDNWIGDITIYGDPACITPTVLLHIEGPIAFGDAVPVADGAVATDFSGTRVTFTPLVQDIADFLNSAAPGTCGTDAWEVDVAQDVTPTGGCALFGLEVPFTEYDITLTRGDYLFAGARPLDGSGFTDPDKRATALQVPLTRVQDEQ